MMTEMMRIIVIQSIKTFLTLELFVLLTLFYSLEAYSNIQVAFLSAFFIIVGSAFAHKRVIDTNVKSYESDLTQRELLDRIEDPHELYEELEPIEAEPKEEDFKKIIKEEKAKIKTFDLKSAGYGAKATVSLFRLIPYLFLILGFIALQNNALLHLEFYLPALLVGIIGGYKISMQLS